MSLLIRNGRVITASDDYVADVYCENGTITAIGKDLPSHRFQADRTIDASGRYVIPGGIDVHTHLNMPFGGTTSADDFETGTIAAAFGGTTTPRRLRDPVPRPDDAARARRLAWRRRRQGRHRLRVPHDRHRAARRRARRDGPHGPRRGHHQLQAVHGLSRRLHGGRRDDLPGAADDRRERRPGLHARRERRRHRRARQGSAAQGRDGAEVSRADAAARGRRRKRPAAPSRSPKWPASRSTSSTCRAAHALAEGARGARHGPAGLRRDLPAVPVPRRTTTTRSRASTARST